MVHRDPHCEERGVRSRQRGKAVFLGILAALAGCAPGGPAAPRPECRTANLESWVVRQSGGEGTLGSVAYDGARFVAVGDRSPVSGQVSISATSPDGATWTSRNLSLPGRLRGVAYGKGLFVAATAEGNPGAQEGHIWTSPDGIAWTERPPAQRRIDAFAYGGSGSYVGVGDAGFTLRSTDGVHWEPAAESLGPDLYGLVFGEDLLVAVGEEIFYSSDGAQWHQASVAPRPGFSTQTYRSVAFGSNGFVAVGDEIRHSSDGKSWTRRPGDPLGLLGLSAVAYGGGSYVAVGSRGRIFTSADGASWTQRASGTTSDLLGVTCGGSRIVVVGAQETVVSTQ